jgi:hypothetical protein
MEPDRIGAASDRHLNKSVNYDASAARKDGRYRVEAKAKFESPTLPAFAVAAVINKQITKVFGDMIRLWGQLFSSALRYDVAIVSR